MNVIAELRHGKDRLDLNTGRYCLDYSFEPPYTVKTRAYGFATVGARKVNEEAVNREWGFNLHISGTSAAERKRARDNLANFLARAGDEGEPLYFVFRLWNDYTIEPTWGTFGAFEKLEVVAGDVTAAPNFYMMATNSTVPNARVSLTIKPYTQHRRQRVAQATGGVIEYTPGMENGRPLGTLVLPDSYNDFTNPVFGHTTWNNGWTTSSGTSYENTDPEFVLFGKTSALLINDDAGSLLFYQSFTPTVSMDMILSCYIKRFDLYGDFKHQPPVTGGKIPTSSPSLSGVKPFVITWLTAHKTLLSSTRDQGSPLSRSMLNNASVSDICSEKVSSAVFNSSRYRAKKYTFIIQVTSQKTSNAKRY